MVSNGLGDGKERMLFGPEVKTVGNFAAVVLSCRAKQSFRVELDDVGALQRDYEWKASGVREKVCRCG